MARNPRRDNRPERQEQTDIIDKLVDINRTAKVAKSIGTQNPHNMIKATFDALSHLQSPRMVASRRGRKVGEIVSRRGEEQVEA